MTDYSLFAVCAPGLEPVAAQEIHHLSLQPGSAIQDISLEAGAGVAFRGSLRDLYRANLSLRTASRVLVRLGAFYAAAFSELRKKAGRLAWEGFLSPGQPVALRATCHKSRLYHSGGVAERVAGAIEDRLGRAAPRAQADPEAETPPAAQLIVVRLVRDQCSVSVDSSGALLHQRGYRLATAKAPLRETLAAAMVLISGWDRASPLLDPFCGSGTIPIEAALLARGLPPGRARHFGFMDWPNFDPALWDSVMAEAVPEANLPRPLILGSDRDSGAVEAAEANAARAGVAELVQFSRRAISQIEVPPEPGWIVTNPPYGVRVRGASDLRNLYAQFGKVLRARCPGWQLTLLSGNSQLQASLGLSLRERLATLNGGLRVKVVSGPVPGRPVPGPANHGGDAG